ncbi:zinc metalloprotease HtpX [Candidatus Falkowbacteria bacterium CG_4_10_14_0_2_um_filter_41_15]|uniref:Protease HtpX homolog n=4 Tax=Candidatus Falkowiibacteriota TaxID=1752728 RepID=A0A2G9ZR09_9BACT|nr:MAG: zinc metalloprotease HtpX [Candidatus Falkowbacteria bacterium CG1_02_41_21]PIP34788.1 MAG: zinc metalloprotease HtpX [Candidatus Falkowbacteria bacterium CG23_combo_of_CG06-09_8_20_14_all_41_10]PIZ11598.1 MAG: zinc metalloprotease HtpX [Candidatus Falkowbacteria bacterium CG_4_10_14_0_8_um_filter_41_36]PJA10263.1 MAG: zinc metalloprotease HtpX [Candidatus Falkowbacteria bacterium CG_4_10_14_0_2_um_filter_41_15]
MTLYNNVSSNQRKTWLLLFGFSLFIILAAYIFAAAMNEPAILYGVVIFSIISSFVSYWWSDKIVLAMSAAHEINHDSNRELFHIVENLCITAGLPLPKIYIIDDSAPNAFATGRDPEHAVIAVTSGLLDKLAKAELEGVIAHELSHIGNRDILLATIVTVLVGMVVLLADWFRRWSFFGGRKSDDNREGGQLALVITVVAIVLSILAPLFAYLMQFSISRKREFLADANGALLTRYPEGLARALEKISQDTEPLEAANRATAHLYFSSPFKEDSGKKVSWFTKMFMTHPPVEERLKALRGIK